MAATAAVAVVVVALAVEMVAAMVAEAEEGEEILPLAVAMEETLAAKEALAAPVVQVVCPLVRPEVLVIVARLAQ